MNNTNNVHSSEVERAGKLRVERIKLACLFGLDWRSDWMQSKIVDVNVFRGLVTDNDVKRS